MAVATAVGDEVLPAAVPALIEMPSQLRRVTAQQRIEDLPMMSWQRPSSRIRRQRSTQHIRHLQTCRTALLPLLRRSSGAKIVNLSSSLGSIGNNTSGGAYGYRMSKAALNMASRSLAADLRDDGLVAVTISPGWVQTDMGGSDAPTPVAESAAGLLRVIDGLTLQDSGGFFDYRGERLSW